MIKFVFLFLSIYFLYTPIQAKTVTWSEANKSCLKKGKRLPTIEELLKIKTILVDGVYWSKTGLRESSNFEYWVMIKDKEQKEDKGILSRNFEASFTCIKSNRKKKESFDREEAQQVFKQIYKDNVIVFPIGYLSFLGEPWHTLDNNISPYNFYNFEIRMEEAISEKDMQYLIGKIVAYDTILFGKVLSVKKIDKYGYEYRFLTTPADMLEPYILPDEAIR